MSLLFLSTGEKFEHSGAGERRKTRCGCLENDENIYKKTRENNLVQLRGILREVYKVLAGDGICKKRL